jgi:hypothetical protein
MRRSPGDVMVSGKWVVASAILVALIASAFPRVTHAVGDFHGHARVDSIDGPDMELYEYKAFLSPNGSGTGYRYHVGDPGTALHPYEGCITINDIPAGTYSLMTSWGEIWPRGKVVSGVVINNGLTTEQDAYEPVDYSGYYNKSVIGHEYDPTGGNPVFQTFIATGTSITRVSFQKADGNNTGNIEVSIRRDTGGNVETWLQEGPTRSVQRGTYGDHWVSWDAGEVETTPGLRYAVRLYGTTGNIQPSWRNDSLYPSGTGYRTNQSNPANHDYYIAVFSDKDGTINTMTPRSGNIGSLAGWWDRWAQSYTAQGSSLAGGCLMGTLGGSSGWDFEVRVTVRSGTPGGPQVGPTKVMPVGFRPFIGVAGVCYSQNEVPTTPGQTYWIVYEREGGGGFNALRMNEGNTYSGGTSSYYNGVWNSQSYDLFMNIYEYAATEPIPTPTVTPTVAPGTNLLGNWSFELSSGTSHPSWTNNSDFGTNGLYPHPGGAHEGSQWASYSHGAAIIQELYQTVSVSPGHTYRVAAYCNIGGEGSTATAKLMWYNGGYPGKGNGTVVDSETWTYGQPFVPWTELSGLVTPTGGLLTFIVQNDIGGYAAGVNWDSCSVVDQSISEPTPTNTLPPPPPTFTPTLPPVTSTATATLPAWTPQTGIHPEEWTIYR